MRTTRSASSTGGNAAAEAREAVHRIVIAGTAATTPSTIISRRDGRGLAATAGRSRPASSELAPQLALGRASVREGPPIDEHPGGEEHAVARRELLALRRRNVDGAHPQGVLTAQAVEDLPGLIAEGAVGL